MSKPVDIAKAWKDETYRASLTPEERSLVPENPAGVVELSDAELEGIAGGKTDSYGVTACCTIIYTA
jgi:mersacidin/lichenicidin family type 2 lantibiotic